jgi:hypothetical protein
MPASATACNSTDGAVPGTSDVYMDTSTFYGLNVHETLSEALLRTDRKSGRELVYRFGFPNYLMQEGRQRLEGGAGLLSFV